MHTVMAMPESKIKMKYNNFNPLIAEPETAQVFAYFRLYCHPLDVGFLLSKGQKEDKQ